jgi:hypothetical protein
MILEIIAVTPSYCQDEPEAWQIKTASGTISDKDFVASLIVVNTYDDSLTIKVTDSTRIMNGTERETINELEIGDNVVVKYYDAGFAGLKAISVDDKNQGNAW